SASPRARARVRKKRRGARLPPPSSPTASTTLSTRRLEGVVSGFKSVGLARAGARQLEMAWLTGNSGVLKTTARDWTLLRRAGRVHFSSCERARRTRFVPAASRRGPLGQTSVLPV